MFCILFMRLGSKVLLQSRSLVVLSRVIHVSDNISDTEILELCRKYIEPTNF